MADRCGVGLKRKTVIPRQYRNKVGRHAKRLEDLGGIRVGFIRDDGLFAILEIFEEFALKQAVSEKEFALKQAVSEKDMALQKALSEKEFALKQAISEKDMALQKALSEKEMALQNVVHEK